MLAMEVNDGTESLTPHEAPGFSQAIERQPAAPKGPDTIRPPWPSATNPAPLPGCPLRGTGTNPLEGQKNQAKATAAYQPARPEAVRTPYYWSSLAGDGALTGDNCL